MENITRNEIHYVFSYCSKLMTNEECEAHRKLFYDSKMKDIPYAPALKERLIQQGLYRTQYSQKVVELLSNGVENFLIKVTKRIIENYGTDPLFNYCPQCGKLARTPQAKQCRFCLQDWH